MRRRLVHSCYCRTRPWFLRVADLPLIGVCVVVVFPHLQLGIMSFATIVLYYLPKCALSLLVLSAVSIEAGKIRSLLLAFFASSCRKEHHVYLPVRAALVCGRLCSCACSQLLVGSCACPEKVPLSVLGIGRCGI